MSGILNAAGQGIFTLAYEISPIILVGGVAAQMGAGVLPIVALTESVNFLNGLLSGSVTLSDYSQYLAHFQPMPGGNLVKFQYGEYPFANLQIAANAVISEPLRISLLMRAPAKSEGAYVTKLATFTLLQYTLQQHALLGGYYIVLTPAYIYQNMLLNELTDVTETSNAKIQETWRLDFYQPLITQQQAAGVQSQLMQNIGTGNPLNGQPATSGAANSVGNVAAAPGFAPGASNLTGTNSVIPVTSTPLPPLQ